MKAVYQIISECGGVVNRTCGAHVHISGFGENLEYARRIQRSYQTHEELFDFLVAPSRRGNSGHYCRTLKDNSYSDSSKYYKLSIRNFNRNSTIEIRQHQGTLNYEKIVSWIRLQDYFITKTLQDESFCITNIPNLAEFFRQVSLPVTLTNYLLERAYELNNM